MSAMGIKQKSLESEYFPTILIYYYNSDICIYNIRVRVCFCWIEFPIESTVSTLEIGVHSTPSKRFEPRHTFAAVMFILFCCIFKLQFIEYLNSYLNLFLHQLVVYLQLASSDKEAQPYESHSPHLNYNVDSNRKVYHDNN